LTIAFGCTGGKHRSVMLAEEIKKALESASTQLKWFHRDIESSQRNPGSFRQT